MTLLLSAAPPKYSIMIKSDNGCYQNLNHGGKNSCAGQG